MTDPWWLLQPSTILVALVGLALLLLRWRPLAGALLAIALLLLLLPAVVTLEELLAAPIEERVPPPASLPAEVDGVVVLGGAVDWRASRVRGRLAVSDAAERMMAAASLAERYPDATIALTGVFADALPHDLQAVPGPASLIAGPEWGRGRTVFLGGARSTYEDALLALEELEPAAGSTWILVTSALHMPRALGTFRTLGWNVLPYPVDYLTTGEGVRLRSSPDVAGALARLDRIVRELGALEVYERTGRIAP